MATKFYFGEKPLLSQPRRGGSKMGRAYIGGTRVYGEGPAVPSVITDNLQQWMDVVNAGGSESTALTDASGNGRNLTNNGISWDATNNWFYLSSNTNYLLGIDTNYRLSNIGGNADWAIEMWVRAQDVSAADAALYGNRTSGFTDNWFTLNVRDELDYGCALADDVGNEAGSLNGTVYNDEWILINMSNDSSTNTCYLTTNGVQEASFSTSTLGTIDRAIDVQLIGPRQSSTMYFIDAQFGSYRIYSKYMTEAECLQNFNAEKSHFGL